MNSPKNIFSYHPYWAHRFGIAPVLPMSREEMTELGWDSCDVILVTGDAYVDHPSFGMALIGRLLESQGFRVGVIAQPNWHDITTFQILGKPNLFWGVTAGNMDSMVNHYTADRKIRSNDAYTPNGEPNKRPDRATMVYAQRCRQAYKDVPIVLGGIEASLRRIAHYDYWSDTVRRSILLDAKADILLYGNAERALVELAHRLASGENIKTINELRGSVIIKNHMDNPSEIDVTPIDRAQTIIHLPAYEKVKIDPVLYAQASRLLHLESNAFNARTLIQQHDNRYILVNPPPFPVTTAEIDKIYELPYTRKPHPAYQNQNIPAYEMIRFSITIMRGCFGGCTFCSITEHEGRIIQNRSEESIIREIETIRDTLPTFTGIISDLGGPTANMYHLHCNDPKIEAMCRRLSCVYPRICKNLLTDHTPLIQLYRRTRVVTGIKKILIASGLRYDLAIQSPEYIKELAEHHVGGYLKIAPEHTQETVLSKMMKPTIEDYYQFKALFDKFSQQAGKKQYLIPYFIAAHPGTTDEDMLILALWLKQNDFRLDQVQAFLPSPMALATTMYHSGKNPLKPISSGSEIVKIPKGLKQRRLHKAFLRYHAPENWRLLREALRHMGRADLIGNGKKHLIPNFQPALENIEEIPQYRQKKENNQMIIQKKINTPKKNRAQWTSGSPAGRGKRR